MQAAWEQLQARGDGGHVWRGPVAMNAAALPCKPFRLRTATSPSMQDSPATCDAQLASQFVEAPWLLPPNCSGLPYAGEHNFDALLALRGGPVGGYEKGVVLMPFDSSQERRGDAPVRLAQNASEPAEEGGAIGGCPALLDAAHAAIPQQLQLMPEVFSLPNPSALHANPPVAVYSMVRMAGVTNYLLFAWTNTSLADCETFNLPCANIRPLLLEPIDKDVWRDITVAVNRVAGCKTARAGGATGVQGVH